MLSGNLKFINQDESCPVFEVSHNMVVDLPLEGLPATLWREHRAGKRILFSGCSRYERSQKGINAYTIKVHCIRVQSAAT